VRFLPTVDVDNKTLGLLISGHLRLQVGQWIQLDWCDNPSRWVGRLSSGTLWAVHHNGRSVPLATFKHLANQYKLRD